MAGLGIEFAGWQAGDRMRRWQAIKELLHRGYIFLPEGEHGNVISFTPPLTITKAQLGAKRWRPCAEVLQ